MKRVAFIALLAISTFIRAEAQVRPNTAQHTEYRGRLLSMSLDGCCAWYHGEFRAGPATPMFGGGIAATLSDRFALAFAVHDGTVTYERSPAGLDGGAYTRQFGDARALRRSSGVTLLELFGTFCLTPSSPLQCSLLTGAGIALYRPDDYVDGTARLRPRSDFTHCLLLPLGFEAQYPLSHHCSITVLLVARILGSDDLDAYDERAIAAGQGRSVERSWPDALTSCGIGLRFYPFASPDYDQDMLSNAEEDSLGTNPYRWDSDDDLLSDYEEVRAFQTNPLFSDTDDDGLGDYREVMQTHSDPRLPDTDDDRLTDYEEVVFYHSDPTHPDTDADRLTDYDEVLGFGTDPLNPDTDCDGLGDDAEVRVHLTDPVRADSDGDGLSDYSEIFTYRTLPRDPDTDRDVLTDYDEVYYYTTNPLRTDTDEDGLSDAFELLTSGTDPLCRDSDNDGLADGGDPDPLASSPGPEGSHAQARRLVAGFIDSANIRPGRTFASLQVTFDFGRADIGGDGARVLSGIASIMLRDSQLVVEVRGHTDEEGSAVFNQTLSESRALAVRDFLVGLGVPGAQLRTAGFGEQIPLLRCGSEECRSANRRVEFFTLDAGLEKRNRYAND